MNRRQMLCCMGVAPLAALPVQLFAASASGVRFLLVFLRGGYDAANLLVPRASAFYHEARPSIAVPADAAVPLDADWGLHPTLRDTVLSLYQRGEAAFIPFAGTDDLTRSHFATQDSIERGQAVDGSRDYASGFMNRLASVLGGARPIAFTNQLPASLRGSVAVPTIALRSLAKPILDSRQSDVIAAMYKGTSLGPRIEQGFAVRAEVMQDLDSEMAAASRNAISTSGFQTEARRIAKLMLKGFNVGFVDVGGWDTHIGEGGASGYLATRLGELGRGLAAFADELGSVWRDTVVVVISEFGRTFRENGNRGTDHGHGSVYWVLGGGIRGSRVAGESIRIAPNTLFQDRDYPVLNEYRSVLGGLFARMYGLNRSDLQTVFAGVEAKDLRLI